MTTVLDKTLKRQVTVDGVDYTLAIDSAGLLLTGKGKRRPEAELRWRDLVSGDADMSAALNASLAKAPADSTVPAAPPAEAKKPRPREPAS